MFDDEITLLTEVEHPAHGAIRVPDGRTLAWAEYGSARGVPCVLLPDVGSSRFAPTWLLHDSALPSAVRLLALDRPGTGASDPIGSGLEHDPAEDLRRLVDTLAVGRVAVVGVGRGVDDAFAFAFRYPQLVASVNAVSSRLAEPEPIRRGGWRPFPDRATRAARAQRHLGGLRGLGGVRGVGVPRGVRTRRAPRVPQAGGVLGAWLSAAGPGADLTQRSVWDGALPQMLPEARLALGQRWQEEDFRAAVAVDAEQTRPALGSAQWSAAPTWTQHAPIDGVPVHFWHGQHEVATGLSDVRAIVASRPGWELTGLADPTAALGSWPRVLSTAATSFNRVGAA